MPTIEKRGVAEMPRVQREHWFGSTESLGEPTEHPALRIVPDVHAVSTPLSTSGARHQLRYTGGWSLLHVPTGHAISAEHWMPLEWLRRFARLLGQCGLDWDQVTGDTSLVSHPQHIVVTAIGAHVLECWRRGVPVGPGIGVSLHGDADGEYRLRCGNLHCDDEGAEGEPSLLLVGEDGQDIAYSHSIDELGEIAHGMGWRDLGHGLWLCATCAATHHPAPEHVSPAHRFMTCSKRG